MRLHLAPDLQAKGTAALGAHLMLAQWCSWCELLAIVIVDRHTQQGNLHSKRAGQHRQRQRNARSDLQLEAWTTHLQAALAHCSQRLEGEMLLTVVGTGGLSAYLQVAGGSAALVRGWKLNCSRLAVFLKPPSACSTRELEHAW